jgi:glucose-1-phosphate cytidylyltransferase
MKCVILAGGLGTRLTEETKVKPKPMVKIGKYPILWHIIKIYKAHGINEFIICTGYKHHIINKYFKKFFVQKKKNCCEYFDKKNNIKIYCVYTGKNSNTAGRILKIKKFLLSDEKFYLTYGDGVSDINISKTLELFDTKKYVGLISSVKPPARYGVLVIKKNNLVSKFKEKIDNNLVWINGGFFIFNNKIFNFIKNYSTSLEYDVLPKLIKNKKLIAYKHKGSWGCMDNLRDKINLNNLWKKENAFWKIWK